MLDEACRVQQPMLAGVDLNFSILTAEVDPVCNYLSAVGAFDFDVHGFSLTQKRAVVTIRFNMINLPTRLTAFRPIKGLIK